MGLRPFTNCQRGKPDAILHVGHRLKQYLDIPFGGQNVVQLERKDINKRFRGRKLRKATAYTVNEKDGMPTEGWKRSAVDGWNLRFHQKGYIFEPLHLEVEPNFLVYSILTGRDGQKNAKQANMVCASKTMPKGYATRKKNRSQKVRILDHRSGGCGLNAFSKMGANWSVRNLFGE